jgi:hypothetical protein
MTQHAVGHETTTTMHRYVEADLTMKEERNMGGSGTGATGSTRSRRVRRVGGLDDCRPMCIAVQTTVVDACKFYVVFGVFRKLVDVGPYRVAPAAYRSDDACLLS